MFGDGHGDHLIKRTLQQINRRYHIDELFPIFLDYQPCIPPKKILPSCFMKEMQLTTEERFQSLTYCLRKHYPTLPGVPLREPRTFKPSPSIIIFQNCDIGQIYSITLSVRNIVAVMKGIRMHCEYSPIFTVVQNSPIVYSKVAPGMTVNFTVTFKPLDKFEDCTHRIAFETDEEAFIIPIIALGPRPLVDFPDRVEIPTSLVKVLTRKLLFVRNIGILPAVFTISTNSEIFSVDPAKGVIGPKDTMQVAVQFESRVVGAFEGHLTIRYETGDEIFVTVHAFAENGAIDIDTTYVSFENTFMGLQRQQSITLRNNTDHIIKYSWKRFSTPEAEQVEIQKYDPCVDLGKETDDLPDQLKESFHEMKEYEESKTAMLEWFEVIDKEANKLVYDRIFDEEVSTLRNEEFPFQAPVFSISPLMGEVWPNGTMSMYVTFEPEKMERYAAEAFCEVAGRQERLGIKIDGAGKGPSVELNATMLDIDYIFLCSRHSYEIVIKNTGDIPGLVNFRPKECVFGGRVHCSPHHLHIAPDEHKTFVVSFSSNCQGYFFETIDFVIQESQEVISCLLKGKVISPTLHFNMTLLDFKEIPIGFSCNRYVILTNSSMVPVNYTLRVMYDGSIPSINHKTFAALPVKVPLPMHPKEFKITPSEGVVTAYSCIKIHLALTPNVARNNSTALIVDMWDSKAKSVSLPLKFVAKCPRIVCSPKEIVIRFCFINFPYARVVTFENHSNLPGFFYIVPQNDAVPTPMTFTTPLMQGIIKPKSNIAIPLTIMTKELGKHVANVNVMMLGDTTPQHLCKLMCTGQGPVISVTSYSMHWEETEVLKTKVMAVNLTNDSPIPATYSPVIQNPQSPWTVCTEPGVLYAEETIALEVSLYLTDTGIYSGSLEVIVENSRTITIELTAIGIGTSIVLNPPMCPEYNLGSVFRHQRIRREILVTNKGQKHHQLIWTSLADEAANKRRKSPDPKGAAKPSIFHMKPLKMMLKGGESTIFIIEGQCEELRSYEDTIVCRALIEKKGKKKIIIQSTMKVTFIDPMIKWNMDSLLFRVDYKPGNELFKMLKQKVCLTNMAADLPITVTLETDYPFLLCLYESRCQCDEGQLHSATLFMEGQTCKTIWVLFDPSHQTASRREICRGEIVLSYRDHPQTDSIPISAEVNFPNVKVQPSMLDFGCTLIGGEATKEVLLINTSPLTVNYWWFWKQETIRVMFRDPYLVQEHIETTSTETIASLDSDTFPNGSFDDFISNKGSSRVRNKDGSSMIIPTGIQFSIDRINVNESSISKMPPAMSEGKVAPIDPNITKITSQTKSASINSKSTLVSGMKHSNAYQSRVATSDTSHLMPFCPLPSVKEFPMADDELVVAQEVKESESDHSMAEELIELKKRCWPLFRGFNETYQSVPLLQKLAVNGDMLAIDKVFQITPSFGRLKPFESQLVSVSFNGRACVSAEVSAMCCVEGGPTECVSLSGFSGSSGYFLDRTHINFGRRMFCEMCEESLIIHNSGNIPINFLANTIDVPEDMKSVHEKGCLIVVPKSGTVKPDYGVRISVHYFPGIPGWFSKSFELEVGTGYPETITTEGYAVIPQLYVWLPRPAWLIESNPDEYNVIADMQHTHTQKKSFAHRHIKYRHQVEYLELSEAERNSLDEDNWVAVSYLDDFPTVAEIELAIERHQAYVHICTHPLVVSKFRTGLAKNQLKGESIPGLTGMPCLMDFGVVVINTAVSFSAILENLGPIPVEAKIPPAEKTENEKGICVNFRDVRLAPGDSASIHLTFQPTIEDYPLKRQELIRTIYVWVTNGAKIPFEVRATVILPFVTLSSTTVNFEQVLCSHCKLIKICVANTGWADCMWSAHLVGEHSRSITSGTISREKKRGEAEYNMNSAFTIRAASGMLKPGTHTHLEIFFQPIVNGLHKNTIDVIVDHNPEVLKIKLSGEGLLPNLVLSSESIIFEACLPYPEQHDKVIVVENPCTFPVEFIFPDIDRQIDIEDRILRVICHYYNMDEFLIPIRKPGDCLPKELYDFYQLMIDEINMKLLQDFMKRDQTSSTKLHSRSLTDRVYSATRKRSSVKGTHSKTSSIAVGLLSKDSIRPSSIKSQTSAGADTIDDKTPEIIEAAIHDHINELQLAYNFEATHYMDHDPIKVCLHNALEPPPPIDITIPKSGVFIVFHGAPFTDYLLAAHRAARALSLAVVNIDQMILDTIVSSDSQNALKAKRLINQAYNEQLGISLEDAASEPENMSEFDQFYNLKDKVDALHNHLNARLLAKPSKKDSKTKSGGKTPKGTPRELSPKVSASKKSKKSSRGSSKSSKGDLSTGILGNLSLDLVVELFKERLQRADCLEGAIVDGLNSLFFEYNATQALTALLKAVGNIKYMQFITFFNSFATHVNTIAKEKAEKDKRTVAEMEAKVAYLESLSDDEMLPEEDKVLYRELKLKMRRAKQTQRQEQERARKKQRSEKLAAKNKDKPALAPKPLQLTKKTPAVKESTSSSMEKKTPKPKSGLKQTTPKTISASSESQPKDKKSSKSVLTDLQSKFQNYQKEYDELLPILENWDRVKLEIVDLPAPAAKPPKKAVAKGKKTGPVTSEPTLPTTPTSIPNIEISPESEMKHQLLKGVPVWIIDARKPGTDKVKTVLDALQNTDEIHNSKPSSDEQVDERNLVLNFLCLHKPPIRTKTCFSPYFALSHLPNPIKVKTSSEELEDYEPTAFGTLESESKSLNSNASNADPATSNKGSSPHQVLSPNEGMQSELSLGCQTVESDGIFKSRWVLQPGEKVYWNIHFQPPAVGEYSHCYNLDLVDWNASYKFETRGFCDIPKLYMDPYTLYPKIEWAKRGEKFYHPTYFLGKMILDFGPVLIPKSDDIKSYKARTIGANINLLNCSTLPLECTVFYLDNSAVTEQFTFTPSLLNIMPGTVEKLALSASPTHFGKNSETIGLCVKNNPHVEIVKLVCYGIVSEFEIEPRIINFEHILLYRTESKSITLYNKCLVSLSWKFLDIKDLSEDIKISETSGVIKPLENKVVVFTYEAKEVQEIVRQPIRVEVYEAESRTYKEPVIWDEILVSAETCDVMVDIKFHHVDDKFVKFGDVKVGKKYVQPMQIINTGKYDLLFRIEPAETDVEIPDREHTLWIEPESAIAPSGEVPTGVQVYFKPEVQLDLQHALFKCMFYDTYNKSVVVGIVPITIAARSFYSEFKIQPVPDINFGAMLIGTRKEVKLCIENTGQFFFTYAISTTKVVEEKKPKVKSRDGSGKSNSSGGKKSAEKPDKPPTPGEKEKVAKPNSASAKTSKASTKSGKSKKQPSTAFLQLGPFTIQEPYGTVEPGESALLSVSCFTNAKGEHNEEVKVTISEDNPQNKPCLIKLLAVGAVPKVDFSNIENIFAEHYICENLGDIDVPDEAESHSVYLKDCSTLKFFRVIIGTYFTARIKLYNSGLVQSDLDAVITEQSAFFIYPPKLSIAPLSTETLCITFSPSRLEVYKAVLEVGGELLLGTNRLTVNLEGEGVTPQVTIISPPIRDSEGRTLLVFRPTAVGHSSSKQIIIKNTGVVACQMIIEINNNVDGFFTMYSTTDAKPYMPSDDRMGTTWHTTIVNMALAQSATFVFKFKPTCYCQANVDVRVFVLHNLYENETVLLSAEGYVEDITFDSTDENVLPVDIEEDLDPPPYHVNFGKQYVNHVGKQFFKVTNNSELETYRYEWAPHPCIDICPSVGHIRPLMSKETRIIFVSNAPVKLDKVEINCEITQIRYYPNQSVYSWDDKILQDLVSLPASEEEFEHRSSDGESMGTLGISEPRHRSLTGTKRIVKLTVTAESSYAGFLCSAEQVNFNDTFMFQRVSRSFTLTNVSEIYMDFSWGTETVDLCPILDIDDATLKADSMTSVELLDITACTSHPQVVRVESKVTNSSCSFESDASLEVAENTGRIGSARFPIKKQSGIDAKPRPYTAQAQSVRGIVARPASALTGFLADLAGKENERQKSKHSQRKSFEIVEYNPYTLEPASGRLQPGETVEIKLSFAPLDVGIYKSKLACKIPNLPPDVKQPDVFVSGRCLLPMAHFEIGESDYLRSGRRHDFLASTDPSSICKEIVLDPDIRVLEFHVLGVGGTFSRKFKLINPTNHSYNFLWSTSPTPSTSSVSPFCCVTTDGHVQKGRCFEMEFCFVPPNVGTFESLWTFNILDHGVEIPFLLVGHAAHPAVCFNCPYLLMPATIVGVATESTVTLISKADSKVEFSILPNSLYSEGRFQVLEVTPEKGTIGAGGEQELRITLTPNASGSVSFKLKCAIEKAASPLVLVVEAVTFRVQPAIIYEPLGQKRITLDPLQSNKINLGAVTAKYPQTVRFQVVNLGKISLFYKWMFDKTLAEIKKVHIEIKNECGQVMHESKATTTLIISLLSKTILKDFPISLEITRGPTYNLLLHATASQPTFTFTFSQYDFGPCFIQQDDECRNSVKLGFVNNDTKELMLECIFTKKPHLGICMPNEPVPPRSCINVVIDFYPLARTKYNESLLFVVNGVHQKKVNISGEGIDAMISLVNPRDKLINLGAVHIGKSARCLVPVVNKARAPIRVDFKLCPPPDSDSADVSLEDVLKLIPSTPVILKPNLAIDLVIKFRPSTRMKLFNAKICMSFVDRMEPLLVVSGNCVAAEFSLNRSYLPFGAVVEGCSLDMKLALVNSGDLGGKFEWKCDEWDCENFEISPPSGYCSPGQEVMFVITFHPEKLQLVIRDEVKCYVENYGTLNLTLTGSCVPKPLPIETVSFVTPVRQRLKKELTISNKSNQHWQLTPMLSGDFFSGDDLIIVDSQSSENYEIVYFPLTMTKTGVKHKGSLLLQLPDGQALIYDLVGTAEGPIGADMITRKIMAKTPHTEVLSVMNWLPGPQRFYVDKELGKNEKTDHPYEITGADFLDIPGLSVRNFRVGFFLYKEGELNFKITFTNMESGEYQFQELALTAVKRGPLEVINLATCVRCPTRHDIPVENPLSRSTSFAVVTSAPDLTYPTQHVVPPGGSDVVTLEYLPLRPSEGVHSLELVSADLGSYLYEIQLLAVAAPNQKVTSFTAVLGQNSTAFIEVQNLAKVPTVFQCSINNEQFWADKLLSVDASSQGSVEITYEPTMIGTLQAELTVTSEEAGEYIFPLIGNCMSPKPQGPFTVEVSSWLTIPFKNIFSETKTFHMRVDVQSFLLQSSTETLHSKEEMNITIGIQPSAVVEIRERHFPLTGKLVVSCNDPALADVKWTYYLQGVLS